MRRSNQLILLLSSTVLALPVTAAFAQERHAYFGQTHQHTSWSLDAYIIGNTVTGPEEAYQYSMGQTIKHPAGFDVKIKTPLDFQGVTDHSEYVGVVRLANDPTSPISKLPVAAKLKVTKDNSATKIFEFLADSIASHKPLTELVDPAVVGSVWKQNVAIADKYNKPGQFTAFCSYEWTSMPNNQNMHRNVFFKDCAKVPAAPFSALESDHPEDLWTWMDGQRKAGNEVLAISHNANLSNGIMFPTDVDSKGNPLDAAWAQQRMTNEPLTELKQAKGASETHPDLSPNDEFANFEIMNYLIGIDNSTSKLHGSYAREAYENGLALQATHGYNPYKFGVVGAGDSHNTVTAYSQSNFFGDHGLVDATPAARLAGKVASGMNIMETGTSGLTVVWAEQNTRDSIFNAMQRKEVYATSGVRIQARMFGGWDYDKGVLANADWAKTAYAGGVPLGGDLPAADDKVPTFIVAAVKDPDDANLDRIQIVKGWTKQGQIFEKIFDVAWAGSRQPDPVSGKLPPVGSTVDITKATYTNDIGAVELKAVWSDPEFDPSLHAFYYSRVLQIPTPRWSTYDAVRLGILPPSSVAATVQERAWTTPIWYTPTPTAVAKAERGLTVDDLTKAGAVALTNDQLKELVVGKTLKVRNRVTNQNFDVLFGEHGQRVITELNGGQPSVDDVLQIMHPSTSGSSADYAIKDGHIITTIDGTPFELTVYTSGDKYVAARSNEFGYANYEVQAVIR
ncbi:hypothetical protein B5K08_09160 [Rhizobium leguminosarum bv. trifolii]|uniref:DUF3604 domain-containing protein n=1 Tax=Rhizobium leguminosarum bv. trifolii TaxID=386 RepID=A0A3E1BT49_RHILT|nr:DUF3604 domain-containing protein [Rhizobium leguminosarum]RFB96527.1 hypothetical protein B5K08_09160 [Rhizobium leguminosarum bv. trifolii]RFB96650.1 hypothetical protein B5K10_09145 [Rhizobium leguminosarum bv. trifolii]